MKGKRILSFFVVVITILSIAGCGGGKSTASSDLTIWYEASSVKILQDDDGKAAKSASDKQVLKINMARNESEGVQMMMYANKDIPAYEVSISDLVCGDSVIEADSVDIYQMKYVLKADSVYTDGNPAFPTGSYIPDALLPFETAVAYKETVIEEGKNQSIYFDVTTTADTPAGVYSGTVNVQAGKKKYEMPIEVTVYDVVYPDTSALKTAFSMFDQDTFASAELDGSDEQYIANYETLLKYNMACALPFEGEGGITRYLELLKKYYNYPRFSSWRLYYASGGAYKGEEGFFDGDLMEDYLAAIAVMSVEDQVDYLDKAYFYGYNIVDEPQTDAQFDTAMRLQKFWEKILSGTDEVLRLRYAGTDEYEYYDKVVSKSLLTIPNVMPGNYSPDKAKELLGYTFVPIIDNFSQQNDREKYHELSVNGELWTYTCVGPKYPYPSAHTDDYCLGFRLTSWMCFDYDLDAFLMWASTHSVKGPNGEVQSDPWADCNTGFGRPGDGKYFYPGEKYGLDTPCPTITAMQYRDGVDDYSLLKSIDDVYSKYGIDSDTVLADCFAKLYTGTVPTTDSYLFEEVREYLLKMAEELHSDTAVLYANKTIELDKAYLELFTLNEAAEVVADGQKAEKNEKGSYVFEINMTESATFNFVVSCNGVDKEYSYQLIDGKIGSCSDFEEGTDAESYVTSNAKGYAVSINEDPAFANNSNKSLHITINKDKESILPYFSITKDSALVDSNWENLKSMQFMIYNAGAEDTEMMVTYYITQETMIESITLPAKSWTMVELRMPENTDLSMINEYNFNFARESAVDLYMDDFTVIVEGE